MKSGCKCTRTLSPTFGAASSGVADTVPVRQPGFASTGFEPDILREAARRLQILSAVVIGVVLVYTALLILFEPRPLPLVLWHLHFLDLGVVLLSITMLFLARSKRIDPLRLMDIGLIYEFCVAVLLAAGELLDFLEKGNSSRFSEKMLKPPLRFPGYVSGSSSIR